MNKTQYEQSPAPTRPTLVPLTDEEIEELEWADREAMWCVEHRMNERYGMYEELMGT